MRASLSRTWTRWSALALAAVVTGCKSSDNQNQPDSGTPLTLKFMLHYHRPHSDYSGWNIVPSAGAQEASAPPISTDGFGAVYEITLKSGASQLAFNLVNGADTEPAGPFTVDVSGTTREAWVFSEYSTVRTLGLSAVPQGGQVAVYYLRGDGDYTGWGLHTWGDVVNETQWTSPLSPVGVDDGLGAGFLINVKSGAERVNVIVHKGDTKDPGPDMGWNLSELGNIVFLTSGSTLISSYPRKLGGITGAAAHLVEQQLLAWNVTDAAAVTFELRYSSTASIVTSSTGASGGTAIPLTPSTSALPTDVVSKAPYLSGWRAFTIADADAAKVIDGLQGQLVAIAYRSDGSIFAATQVQTAWALDELYAYTGPLGVAFDAPQTPTFRLWAPTAQAVKLHVANASKTEIAAQDMSRESSGVWSFTGPAAWYGSYYRFEITVFHPATQRIEHTTVTDPYAINLDTNGLWGQIVDLSDPATKPTGWDALAKPPLAAPEDIVLYEGHIRDFSALDSTVSPANRGKYLAFTETGSDGMMHLQALASAGLTHFHLLPAFDFATVNEDPAQRVDVAQPFSDLCAKNPAVAPGDCSTYGSTPILDVLSSLPGDSQKQQSIVGALSALDSFNWGYDPFHYGAPEGSYASSAEGTAKILEFRRMVQGLASIGLRVVMDVVYNHTNASALGDKSVLDKVVPGYYQRLDATTGLVLNSSCCSNTASEHLMMEKLMIDTLVRWARDYKIDGFRFDLMGLHLKSNLLDAKAALSALTLGSDGVDGSKIYLYGEGWLVGEMTSGNYGVPATQRQMAGTGIGTFNDRLRDGARGGGPFDSGGQIRSNQGFSSGLYTDPNEASSASGANKAALAKALDYIKIGMAGGLTNFPLVTSTGSTTVGGAVGYNGQPAGYTQDPSESINYVSSHDNQILWDIVQYKMPTGRSMDDRVRATALAMDVVLLGQGIPFFHLGDDVLRSKSMERDSYDSGDWFNRVDWTGATTGWRSGLPRDSGNWSTITPIFADASIAPGAADVARMRAHVQAMLALRRSSPLFRLRSAAEIETRVDFPSPYAGPDQTPGLIVMTLSDQVTCTGADLDPNTSGYVVIVNGGPAAQDVTIPTITTGAFTIPAVLDSGLDPLLTGRATWTNTTGVFHVEGRTTAVFQRSQAEAEGVPCNTKPHP